MLIFLTLSRLITLQVKTAADLEKIIEGLRGSRVAVEMKAKLNSEVQSLNLRLSGLADKRARLYEDLVEGLLDETHYNYAKATYDVDYERLKRQLEEAVERKNRFEKHNTEEQNAPVPFWILAHFTMQCRFLFS